MTLIKCTALKACIIDNQYSDLGWSYRGEKKGLQILLSCSQAGPGRKAKQGQEEISRNHVQTFLLGSVYSYVTFDSSTNVFTMHHMLLCWPMRELRYRDRLKIVQIVLC